MAKPHGMSSMKSAKQLPKPTARQEMLTRDQAGRFTARIVKRIGEQALGELKDSEGNPYVMNAAEMRACEIIMKKTLPDLSMVQMVDDKDDLDGMSRQEMQLMLNNMMESNPQLAKLSGLAGAVDRGMTVIDVPKGELHSNVRSELHNLHTEDVDDND